MRIVWTLPIICIVLIACTPQVIEQANTSTTNNSIEEETETTRDCSIPCPQFSPPGPGWCPDGDRAGSQPDECGCQGPPICLPKEDCAGMSLADAWRIAVQSECADELRLHSKDAYCNENTDTWWIELTPDENGCNPACVIDATSGEAEINWRCTGLA